LAAVVAVISMAANVNVCAGIYRTSFKRRIDFLFILIRREACSIPGPSSINHPENQFLFLPTYPGDRSTSKFSG
jgi:hypothetical protein